MARNKPSDAEIQSMLRNNYLSTNSAEAAGEAVEVKVEPVIAPEESTIKAKEKSKAPVAKKEREVLTTTSVRLPPDIKRALELYKVDERQRRGVVTTNQVVLEALLKYIPDKYFD